MSVKGRIFSLTRGSFHDGPGVRDVVYLKGCPLRCLWCHNPEGQEGRTQLTFASVKCIECGTCAATCPRGNFAAENGKLQIRYENCIGCGACVGACPTGALTLYGEEMSAEDLQTRLLRDLSYFENGGGVTFSGGECLCQPDFMEEMLRFCQARAIHTVVETALCVPEATVRRICPLASEVYADLKQSDSERHRELTGQGNGEILANLALLGRLGVSFTVRTPLIPGCNDEKENLLRSSQIAAEAGAKAYVILPYNPLGESKYEPIGRRFRLPTADRQTEEDLQILCDGLNAVLGARHFVTFQK